MLEDPVKIFKITFVMLGALLTVLFLHGVVSLYIYGGSFLGIREEPHVVNKIEISTGKTIDKKFILKEILDVKEGDALFAKDEGFVKGSLYKGRQTLLKTPTIDTVQISRRFSGIIEIAVTEKIPIARISISAPFAIDKNGIIFRCYAGGIENKPCIEGEGIPAGFLSPGQNYLAHNMPYSAMARASMQLLRALDDPECAFNSSMVAGINITHKDYLLVYFKNGQRASLAWTGIGKDDTESGREALYRQLNRLALAMQSPEGQKKTNFIFTVEGRGYAK